MSSAFPQGTLSFSGGIPEEAIIDFSVAENHGLDPSIIRVRMYALPYTPAKRGDIVIRYGATFERTFRNCIADKIERNVGAPLEWIVYFYDRRFDWQFGKIDGAYNQRWKNGTELREETKKEPSKLVELCLKAMGETNYVLGRIKDFDGLDWPEVTWNNASPTNSAQELCERYGCRLIFSDDQTVVVKIGTGQDLDVSGRIYPVVEEAPEYNPPETPGKIVLRTAPTSVQADLPLIAVGVDVDGTIKPIDKLSYAPGPEFLQDQPAGVDLSTGTYVDNPTAFWNEFSENIFFYGLPAPYLRNLASENIFRLYQIRPPSNFKGLNLARGDSATDTTLPDLEAMPFASPADAKNILWRIALQTEQNDRMSRLADPLNSAFDEFNRELGSSGLPAWVYGQFANALSNYSNNVLLDTQDEGAGTTFVKGKPGILRLDPSNVVSPALKNTSTIPSTNDHLTVSIQVAESGFYTGGFSVIPEWGLVKFAEGVFQRQNPKNAGVTYLFADGSTPDPGRCNYVPALWLRTRFLLREPDTRGWVRAERVRVLDKSNPIVRYVVRDDLQPRLTFRYHPPANISSYPPTFGVVYIDNTFLEAPLNAPPGTKRICEVADAILDEIEEEYQTISPQGVVYAGFVPLKIDGAIREITWFVGRDGRAFTRVMRNQEYLVWHQDYGERRLAERQRAKLNQKPDPEPPPKQVAQAGLGVF